MRVPLIAAGLLAALPAAAQSDAQPYKALGTEPFWAVTIGSSTMRYEAPGGRAISVAKPRPIVGFNGERYVTRRMTVDITHVECSDGMSDRTFHDTVTVTLDGRTLKGCGGAILSDAPRPTLLEGEWTIQSINGRPVAAGTHPTIRFQGSKVSGNATCNRFNGSFTFTRGRLVNGPLATTRMACAGRGANAQEASVLRVLGERLTVSRNPNGKLVLTGARGAKLVLAPQRRR